jgi:hypothetical protein
MIQGAIKKFLYRTFGEMDRRVHSRLLSVTPAITPSPFLSSLTYHLAQLIGQLKPRLAPWKLRYFDFFVVATKLNQFEFEKYEHKLRQKHALA